MCLNDLPAERVEKGVEEVKVVLSKIREMCDAVLESENTSFSEDKYITQFNIAANLLNTLYVTELASFMFESEDVKRIRDMSRDFEAGIPYADLLTEEDRRKVIAAGKKLDLMHEYSTELPRLFKALSRVAQDNLSSKIEERNEE